MRVHVCPCARVPVYKLTNIQSAQIQVTLARCRPIRSMLLHTLNKIKEQMNDASVRAQAFVNCCTRVSIVTMLLDRQAQFERER